PGDSPAEPDTAALGSFTCQCLRFLAVILGTVQHRTPPATCGALQLETRRDHFVALAHRDERSWCCWHDGRPDRDPQGSAGGLGFDTRMYPVPRAAGDAGKPCITVVIITTVIQGC